MLFDGGSVAIAELLILTVEWLLFTNNRVRLLVDDKLYPS